MKVNGPLSNMNGPQQIHCVKEITERGASYYYSDEDRE